MEKAYHTIARNYAMVLFPNIFILVIINRLKFVTNIIRDSATESKLELVALKNMEIISNMYYLLFLGFITFSFYYRVP